MKKINILILISLFLISFNIKISGQEDTAIIENSIEPVYESDFKQKREYKYLDNNFREEKTIFKLETSAIDYIYRYGGKDPFDHINLALSIEKKISPSFSIILDNGIRYSRYSNDGYKFSDLGLRYYYSMNKRIKMSSGVNNFHGNYFSLKIDEWITCESSGFSGWNVWNFDPYIDLSWGIQRRINKWGFVDVGPYFKFGQYDFGVGLNLMFGIGWGLKK